LSEFLVDLLFTTFATNTTEVLMARMLALRDAIRE